MNTGTNHDANAERQPFRNPANLPPNPDERPTRENSVITNRTASIYGIILLKKGKMRDLRFAFFTVFVVIGAFLFFIGLSVFLP